MGDDCKLGDLRPPPLGERYTREHVAMKNGTSFSGNGNGSTGRLRSLKQFLEQRQVLIGIRVSERPFEREGEIVTLPFYLLSKLPEFLQ